MKKTIQSYLMFTTMPYRILLMIAAPVLAVAAPLLMDMLLGTFLFTYYYILAACISGVILVFSEIILDNWSFGGITAKAGGMPTCINTSQYGAIFVKHAILVNMARQLLAQTLVLVGQRIICCQRTGEAFWSVDGLLSCVIMILLGYFFTILGVTITRFFMLLMVKLVIVCVINVMFGFSTYILVFGMVPASIAVLVLSILISVISVKIVMKKEAESYYDETD